MSCPVGHLLSVLHVLSPLWFAHTSAVEPVLAPVETALKDGPALRRQSELPKGEDMEIVGSSLLGKYESSPAPLPYMRYTLRAQLAFGNSLRAPSQVLNWIEFKWLYGSLSLRMS